MSKFLKLMLSGLMALVFVFGSVSIVHGNKNKNQPGDWVVQSGRSKRRISSVDELCTRPWRAIKQIELSDYYCNGCNQNDKTKYTILEELQQLNKLNSSKKNSSNSNNWYKLNFSGRNMEWCIKSVSAKNFDEYVSKAQSLLKKLLERKIANECYSFDQNDISGCVTLKAVVTENNEKYCLALGLDNSDKLSIKAFYKFSNEDEVKQNIIDEWGMTPWGELKNIRLPNYEDLSVDYETKYNILKNLERSGNLWELKFADEKSTTDHCNRHGNGVGAGKDADEYLGKAQSMIKTLLGRTNERLDEVKYKFTEDQINRVALTAIISEDSDKYFLALGLDKSDELCIKTFYKFSNKKIAKSYRDNTPLLCTITSRDNWNYAEYEDVSIRISNARQEKINNKVYVIIDGFDGDEKPIGHILSKAEITSPKMSNKCVLRGKVEKKHENGAITVKDNRYDKLLTYIGYQYVSDGNLNEGSDISYFITGKNYKGHIGSMLRNDGTSLTN